MLKIDLPPKDENPLGTSPETNTPGLDEDQEPLLQQVETGTPEPAEDEPPPFTADQIPKWVAEQAAQHEMSPEEVAERNRRKAQIVGDMLEGPEMVEMKKFYDPIHAFLKNMSEDPEANFNPERVHLNYGVALPFFDEEGNLVAQDKRVETYHDVLRLRATIPEDLRTKGDVIPWDWGPSSNKRPRGKIDIFAHSDFWSRLSDVDDPLSKYESEFYALVGRVVNEQLADEYALAVEKGDVGAPSLGDEEDGSSKSGSEIAVATGAERGGVPAEHTKSEWQKRLDNLISQAKGKLYAATETLRTNKSAEKLKGYLDKRLGALSSQGKEMSGFEKGFRWLGEKYNTLPRWPKLGVGVALGLGAGVSMAYGALPLAIGCFSGVYMQRLAGFMGKALENEAKLEKERPMGKWNRERAMWGALKYTTAMTLGMLALSYGTKEAIEYARGHGWGDKVMELLTGHRSPEVKTRVAGPRPASVGGSGPGATARAVAEAGEMKPEGAEALNLSVGASSHGYEGMLKDLMKHLPENPPAGMDPDSDLARLFEAKADPARVGKILHDLATEHKFAVGGGSVRIDPSAHLSIGKGGELLFSDATHTDIVSAVENMKVLRPHAPLAPAPHIGVAGAEAPINVDLPSDTGASVGKAVSDAAPPPASLAPDPTVVRTGSGGTLVDSEGHPVHSTDFAQYSEQTPTPVSDATPNPVPEQGTSGGVKLEEAGSIPERSPSATEQAGSIINAFNIEVPTSEPHIYADTGGEHLLVYGGTSTERAKTILEYLLKNPDKVVYAADSNGAYRIPWHLVNGEAVPEAPVQTGGFLGFFKSFMEAPKPDEFARLIK
jgi:hypothetical protein